MNDDSMGGDFKGATSFDEEAITVDSMGGDFSGEDEDAMTADSMGGDFNGEEEADDSMGGDK